MIFTFIPEPKSSSQAAFQSRIIARGQSLVADGYRVYDRGASNPDLTTVQGLYFVHSPEGALYEVNTNKNTCECPCCVKNGYCKHLVYCAQVEEEKREEAQAAELEEYARHNGLTD